MKSDRKMDSRETIIVNNEKGNGSNPSACSPHPAFSPIHRRNQSVCSTMNHTRPAWLAIRSPSRSALDLRSNASVRLDGHHLHAQPRARYGANTASNLHRLLTGINRFGVANGDPKKSALYPLLSQYLYGRAKMASGS